MSLLPSGYSSWAMNPSSLSSKSTVALSVSIEARASPGEILSPIFFLHCAMLP